jgi:hypothetical protein
MNLYNIIWLIIFVSGGVSLGILGLSDLQYFPLLLVNSHMLDSLTISLERWYLNQQVDRAIPVKIEAGIFF